MIVYENYNNNIIESWYDSSNTVFSKCYDSDSETVTVNIVFKGGRTYKYRNVLKTDYSMFRSAGSNGKAFSEFIKKYECVRIADTDLAKLDEYKESLMAKTKEIQDTKVKSLDCSIEFNPKTMQFGLFVQDKLVYSGVEGQVSIFNLFKSMKVNAAVIETDKTEFEANDENADKIDLEK